MITLHPPIEFKRVNPDAQIPIKAHPSDAAYDLCSMEDVTLLPGEYKMVGCGLAFAIPQGWCGAVYPRSGLGCKGLVLKNGTGIIDSHYRGEVMLPLFNNNPTHVYFPSDDTMGGGCECYEESFDGTIHIHKGDRVAQLCIELVPDTTLVEVDELDSTDRGDGGFGSSGVRGERL